MRLASVGDNVVDVYRSRGWVFPGGNAVNVAVAAQRAGIDAAYVGVVGDDRWGALVLDSLHEEGVETSRVRVRAGHTAFSTIELIDGERVFGPSDHGVSNFALSEDDLSYLWGFDLVHSGDNSMLEPQIAQLASRVPVSFDFGQRLPEYWEPLIGAVTVAFFSAGSLDSTSAEKLARRAAARGPRFIVVTEGPRGALVVEGDELHRALPVADTVLDTVGAGDSLIGTMLAAILLGKSPQEALDSASAAAAITCGTYGAFSHGVPMASPVYWPDLDGDGVATTSHLRSNTEEVAGR